jgi:replicative DNA helicase
MLRYSLGQEAAAQAIEQDADMVCFIHRPEYYHLTEDAQGNSLIGIAEIIIAKHRNGAVGDVQLRFKGQYARFMNKDDFDAEADPFANGGYQTIPSKMNSASAEANFYGDGAMITPNNPLGGGRNDEVPF